MRNQRSAATLQAQQVAQERHRRIWNEQVQAEERVVVDNGLADLNRFAYFSEMVNYGGLMVTRGEMIADLQQCARSSGHPNPDALVSRYLQGHDRRTS